MTKLQITNYTLCNEVVKFSCKLSRFITSFTITSFSSGFDSAIINVIATKVPLDMHLVQRHFDTLQLLYQQPFHFLFLHQTHPY